MHPGMSEANFDEPEPASDGRSRTSAANGAKGGGPQSITRTLDTDAMADAAADRIFAGKWPPQSRAGPATADDRNMIARLTGEPAEKFIARIGAKLQIVADKCIDRVTERLEKDEGKLSELSYLMGVTLDKYQTLNGRSQAAQSVNIQINGNVTVGESRSELMTSVKELTPAALRVG